MKKQTRTYFSRILALVLFALPIQASLAEEVDFSCMEFKVWEKSHLSTQYRDHDIVLQNNCPGAVYWSMCIERVDPWSSKILETHQPTGHIEKEQKSRVNLHLQRSKNRENFRNRYQEYYVSFGYGITSTNAASCVAKGCEQKKSALRNQVRANETAWEQKEKSITAQIGKECPNSGWDEATRQECATNIRQANRADLGDFSAKNRELREQMAAIDPEQCKVWSGDLSEG